MKIRQTLKNLPVIGVLALGLALSPNLVMADHGDRGKHKSQYSQDSGKTHKKTRKNDKPRKVHVYDRHGHKKARKNHHGRHFARHDSHKHNRHYGHRGDYRHGHRHGHRAHNHSHYVTNHHDHHDRYVDFDNLRFMIGLHTDNLDIILRE